MKNDTDNRSHTDHSLDQIAELVQRNRKLWKQLIVVESLSLALAAVLGYFLLVVLLDNLLILPVAGRLIAACGLLVCIAMLGMGVARRWRRLHLSEDEIALAIEQSSPDGVQNRLINALQIGRDTDCTDNSFGKLVVRDNWEELQAIKLAHAHAMRPAIIRISAAVAILLIGIVFWSIRPGGFATAAKRILMPFAVIDPRYETVLVVKPGDIEAAEQLTITIGIHGKQPEHLTILRNVAGKRIAEKLPLEADQATAEFTFPSIHRSFDYAVQGGDYTSRFFRATVPQPGKLKGLQAVYHFPDYTGLPDKAVDSKSGSLSALRGTRADLTFTFDQKTPAASLYVTAGNDPEKRLTLTRKSSTVFTGEITFDSTMTCHVDTERKGHPPTTGATLVWRALPDKAPKLELTGLERQTEAEVDVALPLSVLATDDYGLKTVGLFRRRATLSADALEGEDEWKPLQTWEPQQTRSLHEDVTLSMLRLGAAEGDHFQIALRAVDHDPVKAGQWTDGNIYNVMVGGEGVALQLLYEQILRTEAGIAALIRRQQDGVGDATEWMNKFKQNSGVSWSDAATLDALAASMTEQAGAEDELRLAAGRLARSMPEAAGTLRLSVSMLADTEFVRAIRILETVAERETPQAMQSVLGDARLTQERIVESLDEILDQYRRFRQGWELAHMVQFLKMLADRETRLAVDSERQATIAAASAGDAAAMKMRQTSGARRQAKVLELIDLTSIAFTGLARHTRESEAIIADAFAATATDLQAETLRASMQQASRDAGAGNWAATAATQNQVASTLKEIHTRLRNAQKEAAKKALDELAALQSMAETQGALDELLAGSLQSLLDKGAEDISMEEIVRMHEMAEANRKKHELDMNDTTFPDYVGADAMRDSVVIANPPKPNFDVLTLASEPSGQMSFPKSSDLIGNRMELNLLDGDFQDLVGDLLEEDDDVRKKFETYNLSMQGQGIEDGDVGKQGGDVNSVSATAPTGNMKPPTQNYGGASRSGRKGARAHGMVVGNESVNRRGRDESMEGQERAPVQPGKLRETLGADPQKDVSTGIGGKIVDSDDTSFSLNDAGGFDDEAMKRMGKPQAKHKIVERLDGKIDAEIAKLMQDLNSNQEQTIERLKTLRKELRNVYLPTRHLDGLLAELTANLDALKESPDPETLKRQMQLLDELRITLRVLRRPESGYEPSLPRWQVVRGRVLDEPARPPLPGYEEAVKEYYELLTTEGRH